MTGKRHAVLVGSSIFPHDATLLDLICPANDVDGLNEVLLSEEFGGFAETHVLKDRPHYEVLRRINKTLKQAAKDDLVLIYFSGHGKLDGAGRLHLATTDTEVADLESTSVPVQSIRNYIDVSPSTKTALILDCCYSGAVGEAFFRSGIDDQLNVTSGGRGTFIMTASTAIQVAKEREEDRYGIFTKHLIDGIRGGAADRDGDGLVTMNEIYAYVHDQVLKESHQEPMKWDFNVRGELIIAKAGTAPWKEQRARIRDQLLELAGEGVLPDSILTKALGVANLKRSELSGDTLSYSQLLDRLIDNEIRSGEFIDAWLKVNKTPAPDVQEPTRAKKAPQPEPAPAKPKSESKAGSERVKVRPDLWRQSVDPFDAVAAGAPGAPGAPGAMTVEPDIVPRAPLALGGPNEVVIAAFVWCFMTAILLGTALVAMEGPDDPVPIALVSAVGMAIGIALWFQRRDRQTATSLSIHWVGWSIQAAGFVSVAVFDWAEDGIFWVALLLVAVPSGAYLLHWWRKAERKVPPPRGKSREAAIAATLWIVITILWLGLLRYALDMTPIVLLSALGLAIGIAVWVWRRKLQTQASLAIHWAGWSIQAASLICILAFGWKNYLQIQMLTKDGLFPGVLALVALASGAYLLYWWLKVRPTKTA